MANHHYFLSKPDKAKLDSLSLGGGVTIDPQTGAFTGFAWGENVGWVSLKGGSGVTAYGVITDFRHFQIHLPLVLKPS